MPVSRPFRLALACALAALCGIAAAQPSVRPAPSAQPNVQVLPVPMTIPGLARDRTIRVYLPPGYAQSAERYPVLYMHDGQNLFDDATAYAGEWGIDETLNALAETEGLRLIVVGIDNGGEKRMTELNAWDNPRFGKGEGQEYARFIVDVLKPAIDAAYRTLPGREHTGIMGSSMGGLLSHYAAWQYPNVFGRVGIFSPSYWIAPAVESFTQARALKPGTRVYFYAGGKEGSGDDNMAEQMQRMARLVALAGHPPGALAARVNPTGEHNEATWRAEFPAAVRWLFGKRP